MLFLELQFPVSEKNINPILMNFQEPPDPQNRTQQSSTQDIEMQSIPSPQPQPPPKHRGYPALANFIGSDKDFFIFRKFNVLSARSLLFLQDELSELEEQLNSIDIAESGRGDPRDLWNLSSRREDENLERKKLMGVLSVKIKEYRVWCPKTNFFQWFSTNHNIEEALQSQARTLALEKVPDLTVESVSNWLDNMKSVVEPESHFLDDKDDLVSLSGEHSSKELLERYLENNWYHLFVTKVRLPPLLKFSFPNSQQNTGTKPTQNFSPKHRILLRFLNQTGSAIHNLSPRSLILGTSFAVFKSFSRSECEVGYYYGVYVFVCDYF